MYRITSQTCEVFDCTGQQLQESGKLEQFHTWLKNNPDQVVSHDLFFGEIINEDIAVKFFEFYKNQNNTLLT